MFAFAAWDEAAGTLTCAIDRMGQKPLYWAGIDATGAAWTGAAASPDGTPAQIMLPRPMGAIAFASELGLREFSWLDTSVDDSALGAYLRWGYVPAPATIYKGGKKFPPALVGRLSRTQVFVRDYFDANLMVPPVSERGADGVARVRTGGSGDGKAAHFRCSPLGVFSPAEWIVPSSPAQCGGRWAAGNPCGRSPSALTMRRMTRPSMPPKSRGIWGPST